jgi:TRAP-type uncharacterized transport system fused permease subunit
LARDAAPEAGRLEPELARWLTTALAAAIALGAVLWSLGLAQLLRLPLYTEQYAAAMLAAALALAYLHLPARRAAARLRVPAYDWLAAALAAASSTSRCATRRSWTWS